MNNNNAINPVVATVLMVVVSVVISSLLIAYVQEYSNACNDLNDKHIITGTVVDKHTDTKFGEYFITIHDSCSDGKRQVQVSREQYNGVVVGNTVDYNTVTGQIIDIK